MQHLAGIAADLERLARDTPAARDGLRAILPALADYAAALPAEVRVRQGGHTILALHRLATAALWAGDPALAVPLGEDGRSLNPDYISLRACPGAARLAAGDVPGARAEFDAAASAVEAYLVDEWGAPRESDDLAQARLAARDELQSAAAGLAAFLAANPALQPQGAPFVRALRAAAPGGVE